MQEKASTEAQDKAKIQDLENQLQSKKDEEAKIALANSGGRGGNSDGTGYSTDGNTYTYGYCTWGVKNKRPDIPNGWGDAREWWGNAQAMGWPTGTEPRVGAVGQTSGGSLGHVVYVERVNEDGTIYIWEMNFAGWNKVDYRTVDKSDFRYIY